MSLTRDRVPLFMPENLTGGTDILPGVFVLRPHFRILTRPIREVIFVLLDLLGKHENNIPCYKVASLHTQRHAVLRLFTAGVVMATRSSHFQLPVFSCTVPKLHPSV